MSELDAAIHLLVERLSDHVRTVVAPEAQRCADWLREWTELHPRGGPTTHIGGLERLRDVLDLVPAELELITLAGMPDDDSGFASVFRVLHPRAVGRPTVGLGLRLLGPTYGERAVLALLHEGSAIATRALEITGDDAFTERSLTLLDGLWPTLRGLQTGAAANYPDIDGLLPGLEDWLEEPLVADAVTALQHPARTVILILAQDETVALGRCAALASAAGAPPLVQRCAPDDSLALARLSVLAAARGHLPIAVAFQPEALTGPARGLNPTLVTGPLIIAAPAGSVALIGPDPVIGITVAPVSPADQRRAWHSILPDQPEAAADLAARHSLDPTTTAQLAVDLGRRPDRTDVAGIQAAVTESIRARASSALPAGARLTTPDAGWDRLVLPYGQTDVLDEAVSRLEHQQIVLEDWDLGQVARACRGVRLLFSGPPGTGKSLATEVVATAIGTDLLVVDVANIVSKWLGETEKNLGAIFDVAERTQAVLFLDEADALFGSRTKVSDAHDRYANLETAYLLQRVERFNGLVVLATNLRQNIDPAFSRRMDYIVEFELPDTPSRLRLWEIHLPAEIRAPGVDLDELAWRHAVPGGWIRNAAIGAAYLAAREGGAVTYGQLLTALRREYAKDSRSMPEDPPRSRLAAGSLPRPDRRAIRALAAAPKEST
ncbi:ATPase family protein associated with various cellular activities (AAA) [Kribbella rubisoli]|uniref:ATPase family protein associated with various cellular activities (AAA) n=1 Tax=Kribbella rubisoli TaxID=3075929 RepID=A0A4Q7WMU5_9ACTN|nr:AAA family ATPase [Kribbella rubisoli]RZU11350.1 ATPase family protein associated with various cellular activities (AAA) [Kribbella rubisoli]